MQNDGESHYNGEFSSGPCVRNGLGSFRGHCFWSLIQVYLTDPNKYLTGV